MLGLIGPCWMMDRERGCAYWVGPHVITEETASDPKRPGWWRDQEGEHYIQPPTDTPICPESRPLRESATREDVERAQSTLVAFLSSERPAAPGGLPMPLPPPWFRGISYTQARCRSDICPQPFALRVMVQLEEHRALVPPIWDGFPVESVEVGDIKALGTLGQPSSPWWALWVNFGGTGQWKFVGWFYDGGQELAPGNPQAVADRITQGLADQLSSPALAQNAGGTATSQATPSSLAGTVGRPLAAGECASGGNWYPAQDQFGNFRPVCPNEPDFERVKRLHQEGRGHPLPVVQVPNPEWI